jgi:hypothetical protein
MGLSNRLLYEVGTTENEEIHTGYKDWQSGEQHYLTLTRRFPPNHRNGADDAFYDVQIEKPVGREQIRLSRADYAALAMAVPALQLARKNG